MKKNHSESGRSLIEIVAVLAIIALLLISALYGFKSLLNYLKYKQTSEEVTVVATRYKVKKLQARKSGERVRIRDFYPEGRDCDASLGISNSECVATADGGHVELISANNSSAFAVIVSDIKCVSCREIVTTGAFGMFVPQRLVALGDNTQIDGYNPKDAKEKIEQLCMEQNGEACTGDDTVQPFSLVFGNECEGGAKYIVGGQCSFCKTGGVQVPKGAADLDAEDDCCHTEVKCGLCGGCPAGEDYCKGDICVECLNSPECVGRYGQEKPFCGPDGFCKPCDQPNRECKDASGSGMGLWCDENLRCAKRCDECYKPDEAVPGRCIPDFEIGEKPDESCKGTAKCPGKCKAPMNCVAEKCKCPTIKLAEGESCNEALCPGACDTGLVCRNGVCSVPADCSALDEPDDAKRIFGKQCIPKDCPCSSETLTCTAGICQCASQPVVKNAKCWGRCNCGAGLKCSVEGDAEGVCQCAELKKGDPCAGNDPDKDCLCTTQNNGGVYAMICDDEHTHRCICNPAIPEYSLPAGSACVEDCNHCKAGLKCRNNKCGCESDDDCAEDRTEYCDLTVHECKCRSPLVKDEATEKCVCPDYPDDYWTRFTTPTNPTFVCCPEGQAPRWVDGQYECIRICLAGEYISVGMMLDYSNSSRFNGFNDYRSTLATSVLDIIAQVNPNTRIGVFREKNNHKTGASDDGQNCDSSKNATTIQGFEAKSPDLNQSLCAYNCGRGKTCFPEAIGGIASECAKNPTNSIFFLMTDGVIPSDTVRSTGCCKNPYDKNCFVWEKPYEDDPLDLSGVHNDRQFDFTTHVPINTIKGAIMAKMCIPAPDPKDRQPK